MTASPAIGEASLPVVTFLEATNNEVTAITSRILKDKNNEKFGTVFCAWKDPIAQTIKIDALNYPNGLFVSSIDLFFKSKSETNIPVAVEIRPTVNGYPHSDDVIKGSHVSMNSGNVNLPPDDPNIPVATNFDFGGPVYLPPGDHAIVVMSDDAKYHCFIAKIGGKTLTTEERIVKQPHLGSLFKSQNAATWTASQKEDLMFTLYKCEFVTDTTYESTLDSGALDGATDFDSIRLISNLERDFGDKTDIQYGISSKTKETNVLGGFRDVNPNTSTEFNHRQSMEDFGDSRIKIALKTTDPDISPIVNMDGLGVILQENLIGPKLDNFDGTLQKRSEELPISGSGIARYITRSLTLKEGFDATGIRIILDIYRPQPTSIEVFVRVISATDPGNFDDKFWIPIGMVPKSKNISRNKVDYIIDEYTLDNISYTSTTFEDEDFEGSVVTYDDYRTFAVKIVMYSDNPSIIPVIENFRAIATS
jgi:hypothetical protein